MRNFVRLFFKGVSVDARVDSIAIPNGPGFKRIGVMCNPAKFKKLSGMPRRRGAGATGAFCFATLSQMILNKKLWFLLMLLAAPAAARPRVVATFSLAGDWARQVGGEDVELSVLVGAGRDIHAYDPAPGDAKAFAAADVVVAVGGGFEPWLDGLLAASGGKARVLKAVEGTAFKRSDLVAGRDLDLHVWGNPRNLLDVVKEMGEVLAAADPGRAGAYRRRAAAYGLRLKALDAWILQESGRVPPDRRLLVTVHDVWGHWADRCGYRVVGTVMNAPSSEAADPSAGRLARLTEAVKASRAPAVFPLVGGDQRLARALARAAGARVAPPLYVETLSPPGGPAATYVDMMEHDTRVIVEALR